MKGRTLLTEYNKVKKQRDELLEKAEKLVKEFKGISIQDTTAGRFAALVNIEQAINNCK